MAEITQYGAELLIRGRDHDASKFGPEERIPYIWLTEFHRCRRNGEIFCYPESVAEQIEEAVRHHMSVRIVTIPSFICSLMICRTLI